MSGMSSRFTAAGYTIPKYLIEVDGKKIIEHIVELYPPDSEFVFIINEKHRTETNIVDILENLVDNKSILFLLSPTIRKDLFIQSQSSCI